MNVSNDDIKLFKLIVLATNGNQKAKWEIIWKFDRLIRTASKINGKYNEECQDYVEMIILRSIEKFKTLENMRKNKNI